MQGEWTGELTGPDVWVTCRESIPASSVFAFLAEHREVLFPPVMFADMYPSPNGRPSMPPQILAAAVTLQALHGHSDFETVQELRCDLRWKAACGLGLYDTAFDPSLPAYFRRRLSRSADPQRIFTAVRAVVAESGVLITCPAGHTVTLAPSAGTNQQRRAVFDQCPTCPPRERSTKAEAGRVLTIRPHHDRQAAARHQAATDPDWQAAYRRWRPPVERAVAWPVAHGNRRWLLARSSARRWNE